MVTVIANTATADNSSSGGGLMAAAFLIVFAAVVGMIFYARARQNKKMAQFARKQGWQAMNTDDTTLGGYLPSYLRDKPSSVSHKFRMAYQVPDNNSSVVFFLYEDTERTEVEVAKHVQVTIGEQNQQRIVNYSVAAFSMPQNFGYMLLFHHSRLDNYGLHKGLQKFTLEGDFGKYFDVYAPQGSSIETLSVLTPDVMAYLIDLGQKYHWNIEINGNLIIVESDGALISPSKVSVLLDYAKALRQKLETKPVVSAAPQPPASQSPPVSPSVPVPPPPAASPPQPDNSVSPSSAEPPTAAST